MIGTADTGLSTSWPFAGPYSNVWFKFKPTASGELSIDLKTGAGEGSLRFPVMVLFDSLGNEVKRTDLAAHHSYDVGFSVTGLTPGVYYYLSVDRGRGYFYENGSFTLCIDDEASHDMYDRAVEITDINNYCSSNAEYTTLIGTADTGLSTSWPLAGPYSNVWFKFKPTASGELSIDLKTGAGEGSLKFPVMVLFDSLGNEVKHSDLGAHHSHDVDFSVTGLTPGVYYYLSVDRGGSPTYESGSFTLCIEFIPNCIDQLWAVSDGAWNDASIWSNVENGQPVNAVPCETTDVIIKGFEVTFNAVQPVVVKSIEITGTSATVNTTLDIQSGELRSIERIRTSGPRARLASAAQASVKVGTVSGN